MYNYIGKKILNLILIVIVVISISGCTEKISHKNELSHEDKLLLNDFIAKQKQKLPVAINAKVDWIDLYSKENTINYVYIVNLEFLDDRTINNLKNTNYSVQKKMEVCKILEGVFDGDVEVAYQYLNKNRKEILKFKFDKKMCI